MRLRTGILTGTAVVVAIAMVVLGVTLSRNAPCPEPSAPAASAAKMKAIVYQCYGGPEVLRLADIEKPVPGDDELLVRVRAASVNPLDWHYMRGEPYIMRFESGMGTPQGSRIGVDFSGIVEAVGGNVTTFKPGDEVFGGRTGAFAEFIRVRQDRAVVLKPSNITFEEAAGVSIAAVTALQALRDKGRIKPGAKVLINGASGGVGTFAVQIAKSFGAEVTGVCSTRNVEKVRSLGADHVIDYTKQDFTTGSERYDLILDNVGNHGLLEARRVMKPDGVFVIIGGPKEGKWLGPMSIPLKAMVISPFVSQAFGMILADLNQRDLTVLAQLMASGKVKPVVDRVYPLRETPAAVAYLEEGHARGKVVIAVE